MPLCYVLHDKGEQRGEQRMERYIRRRTLAAGVSETALLRTGERSMKAHILIVDEDPHITNLLRRVLAYEGYSIAIAASGSEALYRALERSPDLIVLDIMLPDINGREVCQRVRSDKTMDDVKIICISGMIENDKIEDLKAAGANDFLHKPFEVETLVDRIGSLLDVESVAAG